MSILMQVISVSAITLLLAVVLYCAVIFADNYMHVIVNESSKAALGPYGPNAYVARMIMRRGLKRFIRSWFGLARTSRETPGIHGPIGSFLLAVELLFLPMAWCLGISCVVYAVFLGGWNAVGRVADSAVILETRYPPVEVFIFTAFWGIFGYLGFFGYASKPDGWAVFRMLPRYHRELDSIDWRPRLLSMQMSFHKVFLHFVTPIYVGFLTLTFAIRVQVPGVRWSEFFLLVTGGSILLIFAVATRARRSFLKVGVLKSLEDLLYVLDSKKSSTPDVRNWIYLPTTRRNALYSIVVNIEHMLEKSPHSFIGDIAEPRYLLFQAVAKELRAHISSLNSLKSDLPEHEERIVRLTYIAMIETSNYAVSQKLNDAVKAFDAEGTPRGDLEYPRRSRFMERVEAMTRVLDFGDKIYQSSRPLIVLAVAGVLIALGYLGEETILRILGIE
jgi:hypothetical protein